MAVLSFLFLLNSRLLTSFLHPKEQMTLIKTHSLFASFFQRHPIGISSVSKTLDYDNTPIDEETRLLLRGKYHYASSMRVRVKTQQEQKQILTLVNLDFISPLTENLSISIVHLQHLLQLHNLPTHLQILHLSAFPSGSGFVYPNLILPPTLTELNLRRCTIVVEDLWSLLPSTLVSLTYWHQKYRSVTPENDARLNRLVKLGINTWEYYNFSENFYPLSITSLTIHFEALVRNLDHTTLFRQNLKHLSLTGFVDYALTPYSLPDHLESFFMINHHHQQIDNHIYHHLKKIKIHKTFILPGSNLIPGMVFGTCLRDLRLSHFNSPLPPGILPIGLKLLTMNQFDHVLMEKVLPSTLLILRLGSYNQTLSPNVLPSSLILLDLCSYNQPLLSNVLPRNLKQIDIPRFRQEIIDDDVFPDSLEYMEINHSNIQLSTLVRLLQTGKLSNLNGLVVNGLDNNLNLYRIWLMTLELFFCQKSSDCVGCFTRKKTY